MQQHLASSDSSRATEDFRNPKVDLHYMRPDLTELIALQTDTRDTNRPAGNRALAQSRPGRGIRQCRGVPAQVRWSNTATLRLPRSDDGCSKA